MSGILPPLPFPYLFQLTQIRLIPALSDISPAHRFLYSASRLVLVTAAAESAFIGKIPEFPEHMREFRFLCQRSVKRGKPRRIEDHTAEFQPEELHMARGVTAPLCLFAYRSRLRIEPLLLTL